MREQSIQPIDMVVVNLYPFRETAAREGSTYPEVVEQIDIGGPSMIRSAAKNHAGVAVVTDPRDYGWIVAELRKNNGALSDTTRFILAQKAFAATAAYDSAIAAWFSERVWSPEGAKKEIAGLPSSEVLALEKATDLRYGENPHQRAALYRRTSDPVFGVAGAEVLHGKELSYNNLLDSDAAWNLVLEFDKAAAAVIKHTNPCGMAQADRLVEAYTLARDTDPTSAFGSVIAFNRSVDADTAEEVNKLFVEVVLAPDYAEEALAILKQKKNIRLIRVERKRPPGTAAPADWRRISGSGCGHLFSAPGRPQDSNKALAYPGRNESAPFRVERRKTCEIQCHRIYGCVEDACNRSRPDQPGGCGKVGRLESNASPAGKFDGLRCIFPVPGRPAHRCQLWNPLRYPTRRFHAGCRGHRCGK